MAIKLNWQDISKKYFNWQEIVKSMLNGEQIRPESTPPVPIATWIYWNQNLWLISYTINGVDWFTITDKNLWASQVYEYWDTKSQSNCGTFFQWGNNYWFPFWDTSITKDTDTVEVTWYWPSNYYSRNVFVYKDTPIWASASRCISFVDTDRVTNLWGEITNTFVARKWPCNDWYHVPTPSELQWLAEYIVAIWDISWGAANLWVFKMQDDAWYIDNRTWDFVSSMTRYRSSSVPLSSGVPLLWSASALSIVNNRWNSNAYIATSYNSSWYLIRPFKDTPVVPDSTWTKLFPTNGVKTYEEIIVMYNQESSPWSNTINTLNVSPKYYYRDFTNKWHLVATQEENIYSLEWTNGNILCRIYSWGDVEWYI